jgi:hypothetical protein
MWFTKWCVIGLSWSRLEIVEKCVNSCGLHIVIRYSQLKTKETPWRFLHEFSLQNLLALDKGNEVTVVVAGFTMTKTIDYICSRYKTQTWWCGDVCKVSAPIRFALTPSCAVLQTCDLCVCLAGILALTGAGIGWSESCKTIKRVDMIFLSSRGIASSSSLLWGGSDSESSGIESNTCAALLCVLLFYSTFVGLEPRSFQIGGRSHWTDGTWNISSTAIRDIIDADYSWVPTWWCRRTRTDVFVVEVGKDTFISIQL